MKPVPALTQLLNQWREGKDEDARERLMTAVYDELRRMARFQMRSEPNARTLSPTALVHEVYLKLSREDSTACESRKEFFGLAAMTMRRILVDHARHRLAAKRGGNSVLEVYDDAAWLGSDADAEEALVVHDALERLAKVDSMQARIVEMRYFAGYTNREVAELTGESEQAIDREWRLARAWLGRKLRAS